MVALSKRERVDAVLRGEKADRVPVSAWRHFIPQERQVDTLAQASLNYFKTYDWDWLKVNPRATYYAEAWGNRYDFNEYNHVYPKLIDGPVNSPADLHKISPIDPTVGVFAEQISLVREIKKGIGGAHFLQTVFSPLSVLAFLVARPKVHDANLLLKSQYEGLHTFIRENPKGVHEALKNIAATLNHYASTLVDAGASGLFFAITKLARKEVLSRAEYEEFGKPYDLQVLNAVQGAPFNLLHTCGAEVYFDLTLDYPVHAINWATLGENNPSIFEASQKTDKVLVGGVDENSVLQFGKPDAVIDEALNAIYAVNARRFLLSPGCGTKMDVPEANLYALRRAVDLAVLQKRL